MKDLHLALFFLGLLFLALGLSVLKSRAKGGLGEWSIRWRLRSWGATALNDVILEGNRGMTQIDHLVLTQAGIVVLETKDWDGSLYDNGRGKPWTQKIGFRTWQKHNPLDQNYGHKKAVQAYAPRVPLHDYVVLAGSSRFPRGNPDRVLSPRELGRTLRQMGLDRARVPAQYQDAWESIVVACRTDEASKAAQLRRATGGGLSYWIQRAWLWILLAGLGMILLGAS